MKRFAFTIIFFISFWQTKLMGQTPISGIINAYTGVASINISGCSPVLTVSNASSFQTGNKVLIIQMKGAIIDSSNAATFGNVLDRNNAGNYEFGRISSISGLSISLDALLANAYDVKGFVQLIKVPEYTDATITDTLRAQAWNGTTGGVLAFFVSGNLTLNSDINVTGAGFRGGNISNNPDGGCGTGSPNYSYPLTQPGLNQWKSGGAMKGEGIAILNDDKMAGKGTLANGGGGGNKHNFGGGGGGNLTKGGIGGGPLGGCSAPVNMGIGGLSLANYLQSNKLFLGGGGGSGDQNNFVGSYGANGGGIVIIKAATILGNGHRILVNGADETKVGTGIADGVGGGGGGGIVFLDVANYTGSLSLQANGGYGGDQKATYGCVGTGGGGGAGAVITSQPSLPGNVNITAKAGRAGIFLISTHPACAGTSYFATAGDSNTIGTITGVPLITGNGSGGFTFSLGNDTTVCQGNTVILDPGLPNMTYLWQDGSASATYNVTASGLYWVDISSGGCSYRDSINITVSPMPSIEIGNDTTLCSGDLLLLNNNGHATNFLWQDNSQNKTFTVTRPGLYFVDASISICHAKDSINISYADIELDLGNDTTLCSGDSLLLNSNGQASGFLWQDNSQNKTFTVKSPGLYFVDANTATCHEKDSITVDYIDIQFNLGNDTSLCAGGSILLSVWVPNANYLWQDGSSGSSYLATNTGVYSLLVTKADCNSTDSISLSFLPVPVVNLANDTVLCNGDTLILNAFVTGGSYVWNDGATSADKEVFAPGQYFVDVNLNGCNGSDGMAATFINPPQVNLGNDTALCDGERLLLDATCKGCTYIWHDNSTGPLYQIAQPGDYSVFVANDCGNISDNINVDSKNCGCRVFMPNVFTPDDNGANDFFKPEYKCDILYYLLVVFDRLGEKVFESLDPSYGWDGNFRGSKCTAGAYLYLLKYSAKEGTSINNIQNKGSIILIR